MRLHLPIIGIDCRFAATGSGIGRYTRELVHALLKRNDPWRYVLFMSEASHGITFKQNERTIHYPLSTIHYSVSEQLTLPFAIKKTRIDLLHVPHFNVPIFSPVPFITTIHDLILHRYPNEASYMKRLAYRILMNHAMKRSAHVITVSTATANDIAETYGEGIRSKMTVTHEGVSSEFFPRSKEEQLRVLSDYNNLQTSKPPNLSSFLLCVSSAKEHKNLQTLIDAVPVDQTLILVIGGKETTRLKRKPNVVILDAVKERDLPALYSAASCFILPSLSEGFGLPILEAMACGCPVIASNRGSIPEIARDHAIIVEPTVEGIRSGLERLKSTPPNRDAAMRHARTFTWDKTAERTARVYHHLLTSHPLIL